MKIGLVQYNPVWEDKEANILKLNYLIAENLNKVDVLIFPEMTLTGFTMKAEKFAEPLNGESKNYFSSIAQKESVHVFAGVIEQENAKIYNSLIHLNPTGELVKSYRKIHPFSYSTEDKHYEKGNSTVVTKIDDWNIGLSICYDLRFPELFRFYGKVRTELIIVIANWPDTRIEHWKALLKARAIENQCYVAGVNRMGSDPKLFYNGFSSIYNPMGNVIACSENEEKILRADLDLEKVKEIQSGLPFLNDIRLI